MNVPASPKVVRFFLRVLRARRWIVGAFLILAAAGIYGAARIPTDSAIDRLIVAGDPVARATAEFERVYPEGEQALIMLKAPDPLGPTRCAPRTASNSSSRRFRRSSLIACSTLYRDGAAAARSSRRGRTGARVRHRAPQLFRRAGFWATITSASPSNCA